jgi:acyl-CoA thioesterase FadM
MVLGTMTAQVLALPRVGEPHVLVGWERGGEGRKFFSGTALYTSDGELLARAEATWIAVDPESVRPVRSAP